MKPTDWQRVWRGAGIQFLIFFVIAGIVRGMQPKIGASAETLVGYYDGDDSGPDKSDDKPPAEAALAAPASV